MRSIKGAGQSQCTAVSGTGDAQCSVLNQGATQMSFCSTKFNQPVIAKACSSFTDNFGDGFGCSVISGGKGQCTTFGAADPNSCSAFVANAHCSVIFGPSAGFCAQ